MAYPSLFIYLFTVNVNASDVTVDDRIVFDFILSTSKDSEREPSTPEKQHCRILDAMSVLMKDIGTMDVALTFGLNDGPRNVAFWAHRSILAQKPG